MDTSNDLNSTQSVPQTSNPQSPASPSASNSADFQETAPSETLTQNAENLTVQKTGDPVTGGVKLTTDSGMPTGWTIGIGLAVVVVVVVLYKLFKENAAEQSVSVVAPRATASKAAVTKKTTAKSPVKKSAPKKKTASRKKTTKKRK